MDTGPSGPSLWFARVVRLQIAAGQVPVLVAPRAQSVGWREALEGQSTTGASA